MPCEATFQQYYHTYGRFLNYGIEIVGPVNEQSWGQINLDDKTVTTTLNPNHDDVHDNPTAASTTTATRTTTTRRRPLPPCHRCPEYFHMHDHDDHHHHGINTGTQLTMRALTHADSIK